VTISINAHRLYHGHCVARIEGYGRKVFWHGATIKEAVKLACISWRATRLRERDPVAADLARATALAQLNDLLEQLRNTK
jgi:hypothetical protein